MIRVIGVLVALALSAAWSPARAAGDGAPSVAAQRRALLGTDDACSCSFDNGMWTAENRTGSRWTTVPAPGACPVANLIAQHVGGADAAAAGVAATLPPPPPVPPAAQRPLNVFMFGSSVDALFLENFCDWAQARRPSARANRTPWDQIHLRRSGLARCDVEGAGLRVFHAWHFGVHLDGPYHEDRAGNLHYHLRQAAAELGRAPDVVLLGTGLWDGARVVTRDHGNNGTHPPLLAVDWIRGFAANATVRGRSFEGALSRDAVQTRPANVCLLSQQIICCTTLTCAGALHSNSPTCTHSHRAWSTWLGSCSLRRSSRCAPLRASSMTTTAAQHPHRRASRWGKAKRACLWHMPTSQLASDAVCNGRLPGHTTRVFSEDSAPQSHPSVCVHTVLALGHERCAAPGRGV